MSETKIRALLVGVGGYGAGYAESILRDAEGRYQIVGVADPFAAQSRVYDALTAQGIPMYDTAADFYAANTAELAIISSPIQFHREQAITCMEMGSDVLLEKPIAATPEDARAIKAARDRTGRRLAIGFQWCYDPVMLRVKADADAGVFGRPVSLKAAVLWARGFGYYARGWAAKRYDAQGRAIFDSVAANATAHYLMNMLWLAKPGTDGARMVTFDARTLRANDIEMYDTLFLRAALDVGAELTFAVSHAAGEAHNQNPMFEYRFEHATLRYGGVGQDGDHITATFDDGRVVDYGHSEANGFAAKLRGMAAAMRDGGAIACPAETAMAHAEAMAQIAERLPEAERFPEERIRREEDCVWVPGLHEELMAFYDEGGTAR